MDLAPGYSGKPLAAKLGLRSTSRVGLVGAPPEMIAALVHSGATLIEAEAVTALPHRLDIAHVFATRREELADALPQLRARIFPAGAIWISWPKKAARADTDLTDEVIRTLALAGGLVDVKVCAVTDLWSGLKLVVPVAQRF